MSSIGPFPIVPRPARQFMRGLELGAQGMARQQTFLETIAANISNAETTRTPEGGAYKRQIAVAGPHGIEIHEDQSAGRLTYDPSHPDANADGYVAYPNVDVTNELVDLMIARRVHEANVSVFQAAKSMLKSALEI